MARELHDSVSQVIYGVTLYAETAARLLEAGQVDMASEHLRGLRYTAQEAPRDMRLQSSRSRSCGIRPGSGLMSR